MILSAFVMTQFGKQTEKIRRQRRCDPHDLAADRMTKAQTGRVQRLAANQTVPFVEHFISFQTIICGQTAIERFTDDRTTASLAVQPELMGSPGQQFVTHE